MSKEYDRGYFQGREDMKKAIFSAADEWCGINAYDSDKGACDEHTVDDCRGNICSAQELLDYLRKSKRIAIYVGSRNVS